MPTSKRWLFLAYIHVHGVKRTENKCVPPYGRSDYKAVQSPDFSGSLLQG